MTVINKQYWPGVFLSNHWIISLSSLHCLLEMLTIQPRSSSFLQYSWPIPRLGWDKGIVKQSGGSSYIFKERKEVPQNADCILVLIKQTSRKENTNKTCCSMSEGRTKCRTPMRELYLKYKENRELNHGSQSLKQRRCPANLCSVHLRAAVWLDKWVKAWHQFKVYSTLPILNTNSDIKFWVQNSQNLISLMKERLLIMLG